MSFLTGRNFCLSGLLRICGITMNFDSRDITHDMLKSIDEHALVLQDNLLEQALYYKLPVLQLAPVSPKA